MVSSEQAAKQALTKGARMRVSSCATVVVLSFLSLRSTYVLGNVVLLYVSESAKKREGKKKTKKTKNQKTRSSAPNR